MFCHKWLLDSCDRKHIFWYLSLSSGGEISKAKINVKLLSWLRTVSFIWEIILKSLPKFIIRLLDEVGKTVCSVCNLVSVRLHISKSGFVRKFPGACQHYFRLNNANIFLSGNTGSSQMQYISKLFIRSWVVSTTKIRSSPLRCPLDMFTITLFIA